MSDFDAPLANSVALAPWRIPLAGSLHRNRRRPHSRYFQLATVQANGRPANRTVVFRGFVPHRNELMFVTDQRSQKVGDLAACPWAEACWYFTETREQFRLGGAISLIGPTPTPAIGHQLRQQVWQALSKASGQAFYWPPPGQTRSPDTAFQLEPAATPEPPDTFCLGLLHPDWVDHLELRGKPQNRTRYQWVDPGHWQIQAINP
ncbi:MAG TPA: pyridoxamine 5'-phosphate oxidase family protein [Leptolyngbyaceae cyanobacterium M65_K2018_010]|nr:pyridoxamine 5'-phosphate oxidase family protein [Leptolyngbyaceae cyanobacterium M65_K2018_010]